MKNLFVAVAVVSVGVGALVSRPYLNRAHGGDAKSSEPRAQASARQESGQPSLGKDVGGSTERVFPPAAGSGAHLPTEAALLGRGGVNVDAVQRTMTGAGFEHAVERLALEMAQDPMASEMGQAYAQGIAGQLRRLGLDEALDRFACGRGLCLGSMAASDAAYASWWAGFKASKATPHALGIDYSFDVPGGGRRHRFLFAYDPAIDAVSARHRP